MPMRLLFVCLGNICRSPAAEGVMRAKAKARGMALEVDSAGTGAWHVGDPPDGRMQEVAAARGYALGSLRARKAGSQDFERFDMIIAMDRSNLVNLRKIAPAGGEEKLSLMLSHGPLGGGDVPDPYYEGGFDGVLDMIEDACDGLLDEIARRFGH